MTLVAVAVQEVWRLLSFASTFVGFLCYALSSAFNHLFGEWYSWKIFLYIVVSVFICLLILFPEIWQPFLSPRFKTHSPFWVLTITSVYSFFFDKAVSGKSDVYNLISCAAFAIMSLSLSRRTHCGFEKDLLYFFLGVLIVRLMMIKTALGVVGVCFGYFLDYLCSSCAPSPENDELPIIVIKCDPSQASSMANQLRTCMKELKQVYLNVTFSLFKFVPLGLGVPEHNHVMEALPLSLISDLQKTVKVMMAAGLKKECYDVYIKSRRKCLVDCIINKYLFEGVNIEKEKPAELGIEVHMIRSLAEALMVSLGILYYGEQRLFDGVFTGFSDASYLCLLQICEEPTVKLLDLIDAVVSESPSLASRDCRLVLSDIPYLFKTLRDLIPKFELFFPKALVNQAIKMRNRLGEASRDIFIDLENLIFHSPTPDNCCFLTITQRFINCIIAARESRQILEQILEEYPKVDNGNEVRKSSFSAQMKWTELLERKLIAESKKYEHPASQYIFMIFNLRYAGQKADEESLEAMLGDDWFPTNEAKVRQYRELYLKSLSEMNFQLDKRTGKKCYMVSARDLSIDWVENPNYWNWTTLPESRFQQVAELRNVCWFDIRGTISTHELSSNTHYAAYLVFNMLDPRGFRHSCPVELSVVIIGGPSSTKNVCLDPYLEESELDARFKGLQRPNVRNDGWLEIEMGEFFNSDRGDEVHMRACETESNAWKSGFLLEGIEFRPKMSAGT